MRARIPLLLALLLGMLGCAGLPRDMLAPEVSLSNIRLVGISMFEQEWELTLRARNPNAWAIPLRGLEYKVMVGEVPFLSGVSAEDISLPAQGDALVRTRVTTSVLDTLARMRKFEYEPGGEVDYRIVGTARVGRALLPLAFEHQGEVVVPRVPGL